MKPASYSVLKYIADPVRAEALNIGIVVWAEDQVSVRVDDSAVDRVVRDHPHLARDALLYVEPLVRHRISEAGGPAQGGVQRCIDDQSGLPLLWTEPRFTSVADE